MSGRNLYCSERYTLLLKIIPGCRIACSEDKLVVRILAGATRAPIVVHFLFSCTACLIAVSGRLVERAPHRFSLSSFSPFPAPERCRTSRVRISSFALGRYPRDAGFLTVPWVAAVVAVDGVVASAGQMHGNPATHDRGRVIWAGEAVDVQGTHHASNVCEVEIPPFIAGSTDPLVLGGKGLKNDVFVPLVGYWLAHILQTLAIAVHGVQKIMEIIAGLHLGIVQIFVVRPPSLLCVTIVLLFQGISRRLPVTDPILPGLAHVPFYDIVGRTLCREEQCAETFLVRARPRRHSRRILCGYRLRLALKKGGDALPTERQADAKLVLVFQKVGLLFPIKTWVQVYYRLDPVSIMLRHDNPVRSSLH